MKLSFSIKNWNTLTWNELCDVATETKMSGIEFYDISSPLFQGKSSPTNPELSAATRRFLTNRQLSVPCLMVKGDFAKPDYLGEFSESLVAAVNLNIPYIGIHSDVCGLEEAIEKVDVLLNMIGNSNVCLVVETKGIFASTSILRDLLNHFADDRLAALWNMYHTYTQGKEDAEQSITNLGAYVKHVHIHDFRYEEVAADPADNGSQEGASSGRRVVPELIGEGMLPMQDMMNALRSVNYDGFISLVWNPEWMAELADIEIILTHFPVR